MTTIRHRFRFWMFVQIGICLLVCGLWFYLRTASIFAQHADDEQYVYSWSFQAAMFCIFRLPIALLALCTLLALEWLVFFRKESDEIPVV